MGEPLLTVSFDDFAVRVVGEVDASTCGQLDEALAALTSAAPAVVDLSAVTFMDSSGIRVLISHHKLRRDEHCRLTILDPSDAVRRLLRITGLDVVLHVVASTPNGNPTDAGREAAPAAE